MIRAAIEPFVGYKLRRTREGNPAPRLFAVDIRDFGSIRMDADIRSVDDRGVEVFSYRSCELIPWDEIRRVWVRSTDERGRTLATQVFDKEPEHE